ncbi:MAG: GH32 C-terminal domain-containing protein [Corynebacterium sp.]|nr:GH32 C-terminal domain-containing protein [Corynebacterium sp.]
MTHRPELHVTAESGILDAPAGVFKDHADWHIFHQWHSAATEGARWAHQVATANPFDWEICDDVLAPGPGITEVRAGSVVNAGTETRLYSTAVAGKHCYVQLAAIEDLTATTYDLADDPIALDPHVQERGVVVDDQANFRNFRSPCVVPAWEDNATRTGNHKGWVMLAVADTEERSTLVILDSTDGIAWNLRGELELTGAAGIDTSQHKVVAPRIIRLRDEVDQQIYDVLVLTLVDNSQPATERSGYLVGSQSGTEFKVHSEFRLLDYGHDFTRPRNTNTINADYNEAILFGFMNGQGRHHDPYRSVSWKEEGWANCLSLPRSVTLQGGRLFQTPYQGLPAAIRHSEHAALWTGMLDIPENSSIIVELIDATGEVCARITHHGDHLVLDRAMSPHFSSNAVSAPITEGDTDSLTIIVDGSTIEVFADGGQVAMSSRAYFTNGLAEFKVIPTGDADLIRQDIVSAAGLYQFL